MLKILKGFLLFMLGGLSAAIVFLSYPDYFLNEDNSVNKWYKISNDEKSRGKFLALDMSKGYSLADGPYVYLIVKEVDGKENIVLAFPNGGDWTVNPNEATPPRMEENYESMEEDLKDEN